MENAIDVKVMVQEFANRLERAILREAEGGPVKNVDLPTYTEEDISGVCRELDFDETIARFMKENPNAYIHEGPGELYATIPVKPCPPWWTLYISVDRVRQCYGGPEEGGWWYDAGEVLEIEPVRVFFTEDGTPYMGEGEKAFLLKLAQKWSSEYEFDTYHRTSTRQRGDDFSWRVCWEAPKDWPSYRPYYE